MNETLCLKTLFNPEKIMEENFKEKLKKVRGFVLDCDGVLTNGQLLVMPDGEQLRSMNIKDGYAMQLAVKRGFQVTVISGGKSAGIPKRMEGLGIKDVHMNVIDKAHVYDIMKIKHHIRDDEILVMGDDNPDITILKKCFVPTCPADAAHDVKQACIYVSPYKGGEGCVRDVIEQVMRAQGKWE